MQGKLDAGKLSRRERQIMDVVYQREQATAAEVQSSIADAPSYSAVRALLAILVNKGFLQVEASGQRYVYKPTRPRSEAGKTAIKNVVETFFDGSLEKAVAALLQPKDAQLSHEEINRLQTLIDQARRKGK